MNNNEFNPNSVGHLMSRLKDTMKPLFFVPDVLITAGKSMHKYFVIVIIILIFSKGLN